MGRRQRFAVVLGTRPEFIKLSAFLRCAPDLGIDLFTIHTGQHFDDNMSAVFFRELNLEEPAVIFGAASGQSSAMLGTMIANITEVMNRERDALDGVIVLGDTFSSLAGGLASSRVRLPLIHIEAGLRSNDRRMPEELNRIIIDNLSDLLFTTEQAGNENLARENIPEDRIHFVGNIGIESFELIRESIENRKTYERFGLTRKKYRVATVHRQEHTHDPKILENLCIFLSRLAENAPLVFPLHPATRRKLEEYGFMNLLLPVTIVNPLGYLDFMSLVMDSSGVVTDSGGIQEETTHLGIPCCTLRDNTERPVTIEQGSNKLFPPKNLDTAFADIEKHLARTDFIPNTIPMWDTNVSKRIGELLI